MGQDGPSDGLGPIKQFSSPFLSPELRRDAVLAVSLTASLEVGGLQFLPLSPRGMPEEITAS